MADKLFLSPGLGSKMFIKRLNTLGLFLPVRTKLGMSWVGKTRQEGKYKIVFLTEDDYCFSYGESFGSNTPIKGEMQCASGARASWRMLLHNIVTMKLRFSDNPRATVTWKLGVRDDRAFSDST